MKKINHVLVAEGGIYKWVGRFCFDNGIYYFHSTRFMHRPGDVLLGEKTKWLLVKNESQRELNVLYLINGVKEL